MEFGETSQKKLAPTLWRTCRALMNVTRFRLFRAVVENADQLNVSQLARLLEIPQPLATNGLRALQSRGLIGVRRERLSVFYNLSPDQSLPDATALQKALIALLKEKGAEADVIPRTLKVLKAFTHFNRLEMIRRLSVGPATKRELEKSAGVVVKTIEHHLRFLQRAGLVERGGDRGKKATYRLCTTHDPVARELIGQLITGKRSYLNAARGVESGLRLVRGRGVTTHSQDRANPRSGVQRREIQSHTG